MKSSPQKLKDPVRESKDNGFTLFMSILAILCAPGFIFLMHLHSVFLISAPVPPKRDALLSVNGTLLTIHLNSWSSGGCPIQYFHIQYRIHEESEWVVVSNNVPPEQKVVVVSDLAPGKWYILHVVAHSEAGSSEQEFTFSTLSKTGGE